MKNKKCRNHNLNIKGELNTNYGITLISLVVTIILLIILAGVAINLSVGENGLLTKAKQAKEKYNETAAKEKLEMLLEEARI